MQILTLVFAGIAAAGGVAAAIITATTAGRSEYRAWLRTELTRVYEEFGLAARDELNELASGQVERALHDPNFEGLEEAYDALAPAQHRLLSALGRVQVLGSPLAQLAATTWMLDFATLTPYAYPIRSVLHDATFAQRTQVV